MLWCWWSRRASDTGAGRVATNCRELRTRRKKKKKEKKKEVMPIYLRAGQGRALIHLLPSPLLARCFRPRASLSHPAVCRPARCRREQSGSSVGLRAAELERSPQQRTKDLPCRGKRTEKSVHANYGATGYLVFKIRTIYYHQLGRELGRLPQSQHRNVRREGD